MAVRCRVREFEFGCEVLGCDLVRRPAVQHALTAGPVGLVEATQQLFEGAVPGDVDVEHFAGNSAVEAFDHAVRCGVLGLAWRYCAPRLVQTLAKAGVKQLPFGVRPWRWTGSNCCFDRLRGVLLLELHGAEIAECGM